MVDIINAYRILNASLLNVANDLNPLSQLELEDKSQQVRLEETPFSIAERNERLSGGVVVGHNLNDYNNKFYSIRLNVQDTCWLDYLIDIDYDEVDLTQFGEYV